MKKLSAAVVAGLCCLTIAVAAAPAGVAKTETSSAAATAPARPTGSSS